MTRRQGPAARRERGVMSVSLALVFPSVLLVVLLIVAGAMVWYDQQVALAAAREGAAAGSAYEADTSTQGDKAATSVLDQVEGTGYGRKVTVVPSGGNLVVASVQFNVQLFGWGYHTVSARVTVPKETFVPEGQ